MPGDAPAGGGVVAVGMAAKLLAAAQAKAAKIALERAMRPQVEEGRPSATFEKAVKVANRVTSVVDSALGVVKGHARRKREVFSHHAGKIQREKLGPNAYEEYLAQSDAKARGDLLPLLVPPLASARSGSGGGGGGGTRLVAAASDAASAQSGTPDRTSGVAAAAAGSEASAAADAAGDNMSDDGTGAVAVAAAAAADAASGIAAVTILTAAEKRVAFRRARFFKKIDDAKAKADGQEAARVKAATEGMLKRKNVRVLDPETLTPVDPHEAIAAPSEVYVHLPRWGAAAKVPIAHAPAQVFERIVALHPRDRYSRPKKRRVKKGFAHKGDFDDSDEDDAPWFTDVPLQEGMAPRDGIACAVANHAPERITRAVVPQSTGLRPPPEAYGPVGTRVVDASTKWNAGESLAYFNYEGAWVHGKMCGAGAFSFATGGVLTGHFAENLPHGHGRLVYDNGDVLEGACAHGALREARAAAIPRGAPAR